MNSAKNIPLHRNPARLAREAFQRRPSGGNAAAKRGLFWRHLPVRWLEHSNTSTFSLQPSALSLSQRAFTILELMIVIGIIGLMAGLALPHLKGFTTGSAMTAATRQMLDDVALARQRAMANRSQVCLVFLPPNFWMNGLNLSYSNSQMTTLVGHQYAAYAIIAMRTVGDQPGKSNVYYLTDWRTLPQGIYISPYQLTNNNPVQSQTLLTVYTTNTTIGTGLINPFTVYSFPTNYFPFPSTYNANLTALPYIGFSPSGQLLFGQDQFILLSSGSIFFPMAPNGLPQWAPGVRDNTTVPVETPPGNSTNNPNLIHIDWVTGRPKLERNQF